MTPLPRFWRNPGGLGAVFLGLRKLVFILLAVAMAFAALAFVASPIEGRWVGHAPNPIGESEDVELRFTSDGAGMKGMLSVPGQEMALAKLTVVGEFVNFDATREFRNRRILYHYQGTITTDTLTFTVQNDDGSSFIRFRVRRAEK